MSPKSCCGVESVGLVVVQRWQYNERIIYGINHVLHTSMFYYNVLKLSWEKFWFMFCLPHEWSEQNTNMLIKSSFNFSIEHNSIYMEQKTRFLAWVIFSILKSVLLLLSWTFYMIFLKTHLSFFWYYICSDGSRNHLKKWMDGVEKYLGN